MLLFSHEKHSVLQKIEQRCDLLHFGLGEEDKGVGGSRAIMKASVELAFGLPMSWPIGCKRGEQEEVSPAD